ncbi:hypothetical protein DXU93_00225 [Brumimicrobium aurantiacum]|uniref:Uncharacterized protein n=1 Tax=Brumimicrobium aurantiacum TaxID=1737063 RepID=A0A3E1F0Z0_9FLAO|nr:hypothetical protein DXU93_00225 [Brumimicrobium aurantiacum]
MTIILSYSFNQLGIFVEYVMDIERFTELYCENKDKPKMKCNGKCHLADQLAENEEKKQNKEIQTTPEIILFVKELKFEVKHEKGFAVELDNSFYYKNKLTEGVQSNIFHPPQLFI